MEADLNDLRWKKFDVLDDGFVCLVDYMGNDFSIVQAARVSYGAGTKHVSTDRTLIRYLMRHRHTTPFEMVELKFLVRVPMYIWRQWVRHRTASINEYSMRYSIAIDSVHKTSPQGWRKQSETNKQGSSGFLIEARGKELCEDEQALQEHAARVYKKRLIFNVAREQARKDLPLSTYTEAYWKINLHNLLHFLELRLHHSAQEEIREYAKTIAENIVAPLFPLTWEAFNDYRLEGVTLSRLDIETIQNLIKNRYELEDIFEAQPEEWKTLNKCREREECIEKLKKLGIIQ